MKTKKQLIDALVELGYHRKPLEESTTEEVEQQAYYEGLYKMLL